ncbi:hypothetical protein [Pseudomonas sp. TWP3-1]|uniref:hypothetical protein n=1 Tax=Pseudomonas sp. TWP3-1 TaxID=2804631 RepID=UPI003CED5A45
MATTAQALKNEVEKLDAEITEIKEVLKDLRQRQLRVARIMWADCLDKAALEFAAVAAHLEATEKALGWTSSMSELYVQLQTPHGPACISGKTVSEKAYALTMEQLLAARFTASPIPTAMLSIRNRITNRGTPNVFHLTGVPVICISSSTS